jgi:beta-galactosidase
VAFSTLSRAQQLAYARVGHPDLVSVNHDLYRGLKGGRSFWVMEQQAGQINWAPSNPLPAAGAVGLWTAQAWAHGASVVSYFRWRAATVAQELLHSGLLRHDETLDRGGAEVAGLSQLRGLPNAEAPAQVALLHDYESLWIYDEQPHSQRARYWEQFMLFYQALRALGVDVDIRHPDHDLSGYRLVVAPALQLIGERRAAQLAAVAERARLVVGPRTGYRTPTGRVHDDGQPGPLAATLGCKLLNFDGLPPGLTVQVGAHTAETWAEGYRLVGGTATQHYTSGPLGGQAAVVVNGHATTIGAWSATLVSDVLEALLDEVNLPVPRLPDGVRVTRRAERILWQNFTDQAVQLPDGSRLAAIAWRLEG